MKISIHTMYFLPDFGSAPILINELAVDVVAGGLPIPVVEPNHEKLCIIRGAGNLWTHFETHCV